MSIKKKKKDVEFPSCIRGQLQHNTFKSWYMLIMTMLALPGTFRAVWPQTVKNQMKV